MKYIRDDSLAEVLPNLARMPGYNIEIIDKSIITPVPKSGCNIISPKNINTIKSIGKTNLKVLSLYRSLSIKYLLVKIINPILQASLGCIPKPPIPNQLRLPFLTLPIPGINTRTSNIKQINKITYLYFFD